MAEQDRRPTAVRGVIIHATGPEHLTILEDALLAVDANGTIISLEAGVSRQDVAPKLAALGLDLDNCRLVELCPGQFLIPGFVDTHNHAPQGVTTASYYGSLHGEATQVLADICLDKGQRALVGKCNMNRGSPDYYRDASVEDSVRVTRDCIHHIRRIDPSGSMIRPVLTPRFAISCEPKLLAELGTMAAEHPDMAIQTHFNESEQEVRGTRALFPDFSSEADLYHHYRLLGPRTILAHCTIMTPYEIRRLRDLGCGVAHCPTANMTVGGGFMAAPIREFMRQGITVGLGTDSGGGYSSSMLNAMRHALIASFARDFMDAKDGSGALSLEEVFYMATGGGARVVGFGDSVGDFVPGKQLDALLVDMRESRGGVNAPLQAGDSLRIMFEKFIMTGDDRNIVQVVVRGKVVLDRT
ncbi:hypothetical protein ACCO45_003028 [Purpureocillium lilacinum]|uniref:Uncharacterized protein n=1 Tax=Purpureocillium lilacinum TaxID=33203 RepID=A0ACC4E1J3_PURLI